MQFYGISFMRPFNQCDQYILLVLMTYVLKYHFLCYTKVKFHFSCQDFWSENTLTELS